MKKLSMIFTAAGLLALGTALAMHEGVGSGSCCDQSKCDSQQSVTSCTPAQLEACKMTCTPEQLQQCEATGCDLSKCTPEEIEACKNVCKASE